MPPATLTQRKSSRKKSARRGEYLEFRNADKSVETALYYGFTPLVAPLSVTKEDAEKARELEEKDGRSKVSCHLEPNLAEKIALLRLYQEKKLIDGPQPVLFCEELPAAPERGKREKRVGLDIVGAGKGIAEAMLIAAARAMLKEEGYADTVVALNSVGDRESGNRFVRELAAYYRRRIADLSPSCRALVRRAPTELLECSHEKCRLLRDDTPKAISFLSEQSRVHFKEVLEYLEELEIPYSINPFLIGNRALSTETVFEIRAADDGAGPPLAFGSRYNSLARRLGVKRDVPCVGAALFLPEKTKGERLVRRLRLRKPSIFFLQLGFEAKLKSLKVIELLRGVKIPLYQALARDKLISQLGSGENQRIPYSIIMGQKEALENAVIVRDTATRAQETVPIAELPGYLKKLKLG